MTRRKKCLIMCRTGMGSSMMLKIMVEKLIEKFNSLNMLDALDDELAFSAQ